MNSTSVRRAIGAAPRYAKTRAFSETEQLLEAYFGSATAGLAICDRELRFQAINQALATMNGLPARAHLGKSVRDILGNGAGGIEKAMRRVISSGEPILNLELALQLPTRKEIGHWIENYFPVKDAQGRVQQIGVVVIEVTGQKKLEESLHRLSGKLLRIKDEEQQRVARELHDSINQYHAALKMNLRMMGRTNFSPAKRDTLLTQSLELLEHCIAETRTISHLLHPPSLDRMGFTSAAKWYVKGFAQRSGIKVKLKTRGRMGRVPAEIEIALFRILQEALSNVHRHAHTSSAEILVSRAPGLITLRVRDWK
jgi:signal transduction histidine kinase